ncbi:Fc.00g008860.m01.CDS01 [Cosmosporella sp. VM-42]
MGDVLEIEVGNKGHTHTFRVKETEACAASKHLAQLVTRRDSDDPIRLCKEDPDLFELFCNWLKNRNSQPTVNVDASSHLLEPWLSKTAEAWVLAIRLEAPTFAEFCLDKFTQNCALAPFGPWNFIEENARQNSPLRRFSNHWVAWNVSLLAAESHEFVGLHAAAYASKVDEYTGDPRQYDRKHWYSVCGNLISPRCDHNPKVREEKARLVQAPTIPAQEYGQSFELQRGLAPSPSSRPLSRHLQHSHGPTSLPIYASPSIHLSTRSRSSGQISSRGSRIVSSIILAVLFIIILGLCIGLLHRGGEGIPWSTRAYNIFCIVLGILCAFVPWVMPLYWVFAFGDGIALAIGSDTCIGIGEPGTCDMVIALTVFVWLSIPITALHMFTWLGDFPHWGMML